MDTFHFIDNDTNKPACGAPASTQTKVPGKAVSCTACTKVLEARRSTDVSDDDGCDRCSGRGIPFDPDRHDSQNCWVA